MKKLVLFVMAMMLFSINMDARKIVTKQGKGANGYYFVQVSTGWINDYLTCIDPGNSDCTCSTAMMVPGNSGDVDCDDIVAWVESQVQNGDEEGNFDEYYSTGITVEWSYDAATDELVDSNGE